MESKEAICLRGVCGDVGMKQWVTQPTRRDTSGSDYLLDLVMSDVEVEVSVGAKIRDHRYVMTKLKASVPETLELKREVWNYSKADWERLKDELKDHDWSKLHAMNADEAAESITETILNFANECIGKRILKEKKSTHPWLTQKQRAQYTRRQR